MNDTQPKSTEFPEPWELVVGPSSLTDTVEEMHESMDQSMQFEAIAGTRQTPKDLTAEDAEREDKMPIFSSIKTDHARYVLMHEWVQFINKITGEKLALRMQLTGPKDWINEQLDCPDIESDYLGEWQVSAVVIPLYEGKHIIGSDLREIPLNAIEVAYNARLRWSHIKARRYTTILEETGSENSDPLSPLPTGHITNLFLALVGEQYDSLLGEFSEAEVPNRMSEINRTALSNVRRWLTTARKKGFLLPVAKGRK